MEALREGGGGKMGLEDSRGGTEETLREVGEEGAGTRSILGRGEEEGSCEGMFSKTD
jgi:hypothetical protein